MSEQLKNQEYTRKYVKVSKKKQIYSTRNDKPVCTSRFNNLKIIPIICDE